MSEYIYATNGEIVQNMLSEVFESLQEVVRCRDCKHHEYMTVSYSDNPLSVCYSEQWIGAEGDNPLVESNGFCAWGERK